MRTTVDAFDRIQATHGGPELQHLCWPDEWHVHCAGAVPAAAAGALVLWQPREAARPCCLPTQPRPLPLSLCCSNAPARKDSPAAGGKGGGHAAGLPASGKRCVTNAADTRQCKHAWLQRCCAGRLRKSTVQRRPHRICLQASCRYSAPRQLQIRPLHYIQEPARGVWKTLQ